MANSIAQSNPAEHYTREVEHVHQKSTLGAQLAKDLHQYRAVLPDPFGGSITEGELALVRLLPQDALELTSGEALTVVDLAVENEYQPDGDPPIAGLHRASRAKLARRRSLHAFPHAWYTGQTMTTFEEILENARRAGPVRFVVAQAADSTILEALAQADRAGFAKPVLVGPGNEIKKAAQERGVSLKDWEIADTRTAAEAATEAVRIVANGQGDILVKGLLQSADLLRAVLNKSNGLATGRTLSHVGVFRFPESERFFFVTDAALTIAPDYNQKIDIVQNAVDVAHRLGVPDPVVAMLCAIETVNPDMPATVDAACIAKMADRGAIRGARVEGPLALDNAVSVEAARHKGITGDLAGRADILVAPNIEAANILYKALIFFAKAEEAGIVMGARCPIVLASRSDSARNKLYSLALGALTRSS